MRTSFRLLLASWLVPAACLAQTSTSLGLSEADTLLLEANPAILQARAAVAGARAGIDMAGARPNPQLSLGVTSTDPGRQGSGSFWRQPTDNTIGISQLVERGDKRALRLRAADHDLSATRLDLDNTIRVARMELASRWIDLRAARETSRIAAENATLAQRAASAAELRGRAGDLPGMDVARFAADAARVANDAAQAGLALDHARIALAELLGNRVPAASLNTSDDWPGDEPAPAPGEGERPDVASARSRLAQADALRDLARAQRTRDVAIGAQYERTPASGNNAYTTNAIGLSISVPLFIGNDYRGDIARSEADYLSAEAQLKATRSAADSESARLQASRDAAAARLTRIRDVVLPAAERAGRGADIAIQKGGMSLTDYLDTQRNLRAARIETIQARADLARAALMLRLAGAAQ
ncbi:MAG: TolC family protein [Zoogloea sp.]|uniref:TolC family protein n=1 Tax=Zoogloea sp. TaxID=49181 RepID=UPI0026253082|nr:TolC family protein [Zoogloea sp.]MDD2990521.1 TolC family protein [Zoogloea sp.]